MENQREKAILFLISSIMEVCISHQLTFILLSGKKKKKTFILQRENRYNHHSYDHIRNEFNTKKQTLADLSPDHLDLMLLYAYVPQTFKAFLRPR